MQIEDNVAHDDRSGVTALISEVVTSQRERAVDLTEEALYDRLYGSDSGSWPWPSPCPLALTLLRLHP
jgi:hypothetical protein